LGVSNPAENLLEGPASPFCLLNMQQHAIIKHANNNAHAVKKAKASTDDINLLSKPDPD
jgi:hypothetical protein